MALRTAALERRVQALALALLALTEDARTVQQRRAAAAARAVLDEVGLPTGRPGR